MGNYIYKKGTVQPLTIDITPDGVEPNTNTEEQVTTASESLKEQIKRIEENNYTSPTVTVTKIPCISLETKNKRFDFENKGRPNQLLSNFSNDISAALQNENGNEDSNKVCAKTPKNSPRLHDKTSIEKYKNDASDDEDIPGEESAHIEVVDKKVVDRTSCGLCDSLDKQEEENAFKDFYKMMRDIML